MGCEATPVELQISFGKGQGGFADHGLLYAHTNIVFNRR